jgi:hypothetical protein
MKEIKENIQEVIDIYLKEFYKNISKIKLSERVRLENQLYGLLKLETKDMPYWLVRELKKNKFNIE